MIVFVKGRVAEVTLSTAVIDVGGLGYELLCTPGTLGTLREGSVVQLSAALVVREDSQTLYGFTNDDEKEIWSLVQIAGGVGPKLALAMLAVLTPEQIRGAVSSDDEKVLTQVPGIGPRSAQRIILELKDRVGVSGATSGSEAPSWKAQVTEGLLGLGYNAKDAERALDALTPGTTPDVGALLRAALQNLAKA